MGLLINALAILAAKLLEAPVLNFLERRFPRMNEKKKRAVNRLRGRISHGD